MIQAMVLLLVGAVVFEGQAGTKPADGARGRPLKVFVLAGQSNATGMVKTNTFEHIKMFPGTAEQFKDLFNADGSPVVLDDVYVSQWMGKESGKLAPRYGGGKTGNAFGSEYAFGIYLHKKLQEPFLIIKTGLGGQSLNFDFRPPSAVKWTPPEGHPDLVKKEKEEVKMPVLPIPEKLDLAADWTPAKPWALKKKHMGVDGFKGAEIGKTNGVSPIYVLFAPKIKGEPFQVGDLILGVDGSGLRDDPIEHWRSAFHSSRANDGDWMIKVTRWRKGKIETFDFDICDTIPGGRAKLAEYLAAQEKAGLDYEKNEKGLMYRNMIDHAKKVLADIKSVYPEYDAKAGYELAGFIWFQGWNDMIDGGTYPNNDKPRGYEQYTWLLEHLIKDVRKDLNAPNMPAIIAVMGIGGVQTEGKMGHFQQAQAAVADIPEFKGNVVAVQTGKYWDHELEALVEKSSKVEQKKSELQYKDGLTGAALQKAYAEYRAANMTPKEEEILKKGVSDGGFHYLGSAKIMCGIGKGFAEAMLGLLESKAGAR
jgi:hypothetical protein